MATKTTKKSLLQEKVNAINAGYERYLELESMIATLSGAKNAYVAVNEEESFSLSDTQVEKLLDEAKIEMRKIESALG